VQDGLHDAFARRGVIPAFQTDDLRLADPASA
jgi:hypothetical protein